MRARPGTHGPGHRAGRLRASGSGSSSRPPAGQRAVGLQGGDLGVQLLTFKQHLAQLGFQPLGLQRTPSSKELAFLGIESSPAFVRAPEGNGCAERFIRTLKENLLWVGTFDTVEELRQALLWTVFTDTRSRAAKPAFTCG